MELAGGEVGWGGDGRKRPKDLYACIPDYIPAIAGRRAGEGQSGQCLRDLFMGKESPCSSGARWAQAATACPV